MDKEAQGKRGTWASGGRWERNMGGSGKKTGRKWERNIDENSKFREEDWKASRSN